MKCFSICVENSNGKEIGFKKIMEWTIINFAVTYGRSNGNLCPDRYNVFITGFN